MTDQPSVPQPAKPKPMATVGAVVGVILGIAFSRYCGPAAWLPFFTGVGLVLLFTKTPVGPKHFILAIGATATHVVWFLVGALMVGSWGDVALDMALLLVGVVWLWLKPGLPGAIYLGVLQLVFLGINLHLLSQASFGDAAHRALTAHAVLRLIALIGVVAGYKKFIQDRAASDPARAVMEG